MNKLKKLTDDLCNLLDDEDLDDGKLRIASEGLLPNLADELIKLKNSKRNNIYETIDKERDYQDRRWNTSEGKKPVESYILYMKAYLDEAIQKITYEDTNYNALDTLRKIVALGIACFEDNGIPPRGEYKKIIE